MVVLASIRRYVFQGSIAETCREQNAAGDGSTRKYPDRILFRAEPMQKKRCRTQHESRQRNVVRNAIGSIGDVNTAQSAGQYHKFASSGVGVDLGDANARASFFKSSLSSSSRQFRSSNIVNEVRRSTIRVPASIKMSRRGEDFFSGQPAASIVLTVGISFAS